MPVRSVTIAPPAPLWAGLAREHWHSLASAGPAHTHAIRFRQQLGLPIDRPVVLSGHQAMLWHPGVLAKRLAMDELARRESMAAGWVLVDHDAEDFSTIAIPARPAASQPEARWQHARLAIAPEAVGARLRADTAPSAIDAFDPPPLEQALHATLAKGQLAISADIRERLVALFGSIASAKSTSPLSGLSAAQQIDAALALSLGLAPIATIRASTLARTDLFAHLVAEMANQPRAMAEAYNAAVARVPEARVAPLAITATSVELPLWIIDPDSGIRRRAYTTNLHTAAPPMLAPRGLFMTLLFRLAACDLFIHGTGGGGADGQAGYDRITHLWATTWLGSALAPVAVATATLTLDLDGVQPVSESAAAHAAWKAHHARHNPADLGEQGAQRMKRAIVKLIAAHRRDGHRAGSRAFRSALFQRLHALTAEVLHARTARAHRLDEDSRHAAAMARQQLVANDRTWPTPLYPRADLAVLAATVATAFAKPPDAEGTQ